LALAFGAKLDLAEAARLANFAAGVWWATGQAPDQTELAGPMRCCVSRGSLQALQDKIMPLEGLLDMAASGGRTASRLDSNGCFRHLHTAIWPF